MIVNFYVSSLEFPLMLNYGAVYMQNAQSSSRRKALNLSMRSFVSASVKNILHLC